MDRKPAKVEVSGKSRSDLVDLTNQLLGKSRMFTVNADGHIVDPNDERPVAVFVDSFTNGLGQGPQSQTVILRLFHKDWQKAGTLVPRDQVHQFALNAHREAELGRQLLGLAAQAEK